MIGAEQVLTTAYTEPISCWAARSNQRSSTPLKTRVGTHTPHSQPLSLRVRERLRKPGCLIRYRQQQSVVGRL